MSLLSMFNFTAAMGLCPPLGTIRTSVPDILWNNTNPDPNMTLAVGSTFSFSCPDPLQVEALYGYYPKDFNRK